MPEGPEIRRAADLLSAALYNEIIEDVKFGLPGLRRHEHHLKSHRIVGVTSHGKAMLNHFEHGWTIYSHNQLYGLWKVVPRGEWPTTNRSLRLALHTHTHSALLYSASEISVWRTVDLVEHPFLARLGPDILDEALTWRDLRARLGLPTFSGRSLVSLYLDQAFLAGIGNYLRSEILYHARLHPWARPQDLSETVLGRLARSTLTISRRTYETKGVTNPAKRAGMLKRKGLGFEDYRFAVFARDGQPCYECGETIVRSKAGARRLYWCPVCQAETP